MVKAYLRYEHAAAWGVVASAGGCAFDATGRLLATACLERVGVWSLKQGAQVRAHAGLAPAGCLRPERGDGKSLTPNRRSGRCFQAPRAGPRQYRLK